MAENREKGMLGAFRAALPRTLPVLAGYLVLGVAFGLLLNSIGLGVFWAAAMSILVYAGSAQFLAVSLIGASASLPQVALLTFLLNFRHFFYGLSMVSRYQGVGKRKLYLAFALSDETYAILAGALPPAQVDPADYYFAVSLLDQCYWVAGSLIGATVGQLITFDTTGVDFAMTALFVVMFLTQWEENKDHRPALIGVGCTALCLVVLGSDHFLLPAMGLIILAFLALRKTFPQEVPQT